MIRFCSNGDYQSIKACIESLGRTCINFLGQSSVGIEFDNGRSCLKVGTRVPSEAKCWTDLVY